MEELKKHIEHGFEKWVILTCSYADDLFDDGILSLFILFSAFSVLFIQRAQLTVEKKQPDHLLTTLTSICTSI